MGIARDIDSDGPITCRSDVKGMSRAKQWSEALTLIEEVAEEDAVFRLSQVCGPALSHENVQNGLLLWIVSTAFALIFFIGKRTKASKVMVILNLRCLTGGFNGDRN